MLKKDHKEPVKDHSNEMADEKSKKSTTETDNSTETQNQETNENSDPEQSTEETSGKTGNDLEEKETNPKDKIIIELNDKYKELNDKYLRLFSEFDNYRKRSLKERIELTKSASAEMTEAVLPVLDDLERAYTSAIENPDINALTEGISLILSKLKSTLKNKGLEEMNTLGEAFNTDYHEAITHIPAPTEKDKGKVIDEVQKGYLLNGKVLRFAKVVVAN